MSSDGSKKSDGRKKADETLASALACGSTLAAAAELAGVSERTVSRRLDEPGFRRRVSELRGQMVARALGKMADAMTSAADTLVALLTAESDSVRLGAARSILELGTRLRDSVELEQRITDLETTFNEEGENDGRPT